MEFNVVVTGDDPRLVEIELHEAVLGYLESAKKLQKGFRAAQVNSILNQHTEPEYEARWARTQTSEKDVLSPYSDFYKFGVSNLTHV